MAKEKRFIKISGGGLSEPAVYVDRATRVQYVCVTGESGFQLLYDKEGKPLLYDGDLEDN